MSGYIQSVTTIIAQNPNLAGILVFLIAASESIALIGAIIPGTAILIGVGAIVGLGHLGLWPILVWATLGAIAGDGFSYWLGGRYRGRLHEVWPFSRNREMLTKGEAFFARHGGKSVAIGRFVPVLRSVIPLIAGALGMPARRFYVVNIASALAWAPAHILPGALVGASMGFLNHISSRLAIAIILLLLGAVVIGWMARFLLLRLLPFIERIRLRAVVSLERRSPTAARAFALKVLSPSQNIRNILPLGILLGLAVAAFIMLVEEVADRGSLALSDAAISHFVQGLRTAWGDHIMVIITSLGDTVMITAVALAVLAWLVWRRAWGLAGGMALTLLLASAFSSLLKGWMGVPRPIALYEGVQVFSFPSGHATMAAALYGTIGWMTAMPVRAPWRAWILGGLGGLVGMIAVSRIYLAAHWPSDVVGGLLFGFGIAAAYGLVFRRAYTTTVQPVRLLAIAATVILTFGTWHAVTTHARGLEIYALSDPPVRTLSRVAWLADGWKTLPLYRTDFEGEREEPFMVQWTGTVEDLRQRLVVQGWIGSIPLNFTSASAFLTAKSSAVDLPVLPLFHEGKAPAFSMMRTASSPASRFVLRGWRSGVDIDGKGAVLLISIVPEQIVHPIGFATIPVRDTRMNANDMAYTEGVTGKQKLTAAGEACSSLRCKLVSRL
ncbi:bifunctional DedA family/phosphatase PAP2 family protein [Rhizobium sp. PL01]|uniref:bifunctional DedA family/phosphatase PAP2 family protein n=1 Tax=Rhizobium sp. PL01 TaxID=3085631 RepID=UPI002981E3D0|nr:VTT domain-containing protein [Rhizobium sp. PL01]MDW5317582.1 VTT domain-containing protein [Rhizobium sp. PL01]